MNKEGVLHSKIKYTDRVYLVSDIDELLKLKQDKLIPGKNVEILEDNTINVVLPSIPLSCVSKYKDLTYSDTGALEFEEDTRFYTYSVYEPGPISMSLGGVLANSDSDTIVELYFLVTLQNVDTVVSFTTQSNRPIQLVGDTDYRVENPGQTLYFVLRAFKDKIYVNKLGAL